MLSKVEKYGQVCASSERQAKDVCHGLEVDDGKVAAYNIYIYNIDEGKSNSVNVKSLSSKACNLLEHWKQAHLGHILVQTEGIYRA